MIKNNILVKNLVLIVIILNITLILSQDFIVVDTQKVDFYKVNHTIMKELYYNEPFTIYLNTLDINNNLVDINNLTILNKTNELNITQIDRISLGNYSIQLISKEVGKNYINLSLTQNKKQINYSIEFEVYKRSLTKLEYYKWRYSQLAYFLDNFLNTPLLLIISILALFIILTLYYIIKNIFK